jgi:hypothetical protein
MYLVWHFADGTRYTIAYRDWDVIFRATGPGGGQGLNQITDASKVESPVGFQFTEDNPVVDRPTANYALEPEPNTIRPAATKF